jgi:hypothetical protein
MKRTFVIVITCFAVLFAVFLGWRAWLQNQSFPQESHVSSDTDNDDQANGSRTLDDLLAQAEEIQLPKVDTTGWQTYQNEHMGIEFMYPKGWIAKEHFGNRVCVETEDSRYAKMPGSLAQRLQGEECIVQVDRHQEDKLFFLKQFDEWKTRNSNVSFFRTKALDVASIFLLTKDVSETHAYMREKDSVIAVRIWNENLSLDKAIPDVFYGILQTIKPLKN